MVMLETPQAPVASPTPAPAAAAASGALPATASAVAAASRAEGGSVAYYPVFLDLRNRLCVVIGGGALAEDRARQLCLAGARVSVVAATLSPGLEALAREGRIELRRRPYKDGDLAGAFLAIAALDDSAADVADASNVPSPAGLATPADPSSPARPSKPSASAGMERAAEMREAVWREAERRGLPLNSVDDPPRCSFIAGSIVRRGDLIVAISTSGKAPALAVRLRQWLETRLGAEHARFLALAGTVRAALAARHPELASRRERWYRLVDSDVLDLLRGGDEPAARRRFGELLGVEPPADQARSTPLPSPAVAEDRRSKRSA